MITLKVLQRSCFSLNSEEKSTKFLIPKMRHIRANLTYFVHNWNIWNIVSHKESLKSYPSFHFQNSNLAKGKCLMMLFWTSYKYTTLDTQNSNRSVIFQWKILQVVFLIFHVFSVLLTFYETRPTLRKKSSYLELFWSTFSPHFPAFGLNTERY